MAWLITKEMCDEDGIVYESVYVYGIVSNLKR